MSAISTMSAISAVGSKLLGATGPIGAVASTALSFLSGIVRQPTGHLDFARAQQAAVIFVGPPGGVWPIFEGCFTYDELQRIALEVVPLFDAAMEQNWGTANSTNAGIKFDLDTNAQANYALNRQLVLFMEWIAQNIDQDHLVSEYNTTLPVLFDYIFISAVQRAGLDPTDLLGIAQQTVLSTTNLTGLATNTTNVAGNTVTGRTVNTSEPGAFSKAGASLSGLLSASNPLGTILFIGVIVGGAYMFFKGKG